MFLSFWPGHFAEAYLLPLNNARTGNKVANPLECLIGVQSRRRTHQVSGNFLLPD
jgi:hypothetical protein